MWHKIKDLLLTNKSTKQTIVKNTFWLSLATITGRILRGLMILYAARRLGTEGYGLFSYALSVAGFFSVFSDIGLSSLITREKAKNPENAKPYLATASAIKIALLLFSVIITIFVAPYFTNVTEARPLVMVVAILIAFDSLRGFGFSIFRAENKMQKEALFSSIADTSITTLSMIALFYTPSPIVLTFAYIIGSSIGTITTFWALRHEFKNIFSYFNKNLLSEIFQNAWPFAIMSALGSFMINIDTLVIGWFRNAYDLGIYGVAQRPVQLLYILPGLIATSIFPFITKFVQEKRKEDIEKIINKSIGIIFMVGVPMIIGGIIIAPSLIPFFFGDGYNDAILPFQILLLTIFFVFPGTVLGNAIFAYNKQKIFIKSALGGAILNTGLDILLIPTYGVSGSAVATLISQMFTNGVNWYELKKLNPFKMTEYIWWTCGATALMGIVTYVLQSKGIHILITLGVAILTYGCVLIPPIIKKKLWKI